MDPSYVLHYDHYVKSAKWLVTMSQIHPMATNYLDLIFLYESIMHIIKLELCKQMLEHMSNSPKETSGGRLSRWNLHECPCINVSFT